MTSIGNLFDLRGKTALVTGGLGLIGRECCAALAAYGADVAVVDLTREEVRAFAERLSGRFRTRCIGIAADISDPESVGRMVDQAVAALGRIDILLNNAATKSEDRNAFFADVEEYSLTQWKKIMSVNLDGMFLVSRAVGKQMKKQRTGGSIIQTSSIYGIVAPDPSLYQGAANEGIRMNTPAVYSASKAGIHGLTRYLAVYWAKHGIRVNTLVPGGIEDRQNETFKKEYSRRTPMGRMGKAREMTGPVLFLASGASSYMTGQTLIVDGGWSAW